MPSSAFSRLSALTVRASSKMENTMRYAFLAVALVALLSHGNAQAIQIVNEDDKSYTLTIITPSGENTIEVAAGVVLEDVCPEGCTLVLDDQEVIAEADDSVLIQKGRIGLDN